MEETPFPDTPLMAPARNTAEADANRMKNENLSSRDGLRFNGVLLGQLFVGQFTQSRVTDQD